MTDQDFFFGFVVVIAVIGVLLLTEGVYLTCPKIRSWVESQLAPEPTIYEQKKKAWADRRKVS